MRLAAAADPPAAELPEGAATPWGHIRAGRAPTAELVEAAVGERALVLGSEGVARERTRLADHVLGAGPLQRWLIDPEVTDVLVNGVDGVWLDRGGGLVRVADGVGGHEAVRALAVRLAGLAGRRLDDTSPYVDGLLPGGIRLHAVLPPLVQGAAHISLRVPRRVTPTLAELGAWGSFHASWLPLLRGIVGARLSFVVTGGTGSGKTTLLASLLSEVPAGERVVLVEDVREMAVRHPHVVALQARPANVEGRGHVDLATLVRQSLRMRPDRLVVGEVRGPEVRELLTALNTGHEGGCGTLHANAPADVVSRFEALGALAGLSPAATRTQLASAVQVVVHVRRRPDRRVVDSIGVLTAGEQGLRVAAAVTSGGGHGNGSDPPAGAGPAWPLLRDLLRRDRR